MGKKKKAIWQLDSRDWFKIIFELLVVFIGVTGAFMLEEKSRDRERRQDEMLYLNNLQTELRQDLKDFKQLIEFDGIKKEKCLKLMKILEGKGEVKEIEQLIYSALLSNRMFAPNQNVWDSMKNSGELGKVSKSGLKIKLSEHYEFYNVIKKHEGFIIDFLNHRIMDVLVEAYHFKQLKVQSEGMIKSFSFLNKISLYTSLINEHITYLETALSNGKSLYKMIDKELEEK